MENPIKMDDLGYHYFGNIHNHVVFKQNASMFIFITM